MTSAPHRRRYSVGLWLALITIFAHALAPSGSPLTRSWGSAFNAFTSDVSLGPKRADALERHRSERGNPASAGGSEADAVLAYTHSSLPPPLQTTEADFPAPPAIAPARLARRSFKPRAPPFA